MLEPLKKLGRTMRRDHTTAVSIGACAAVPVVAGVLGLALGGLLPWLVAGVIFSGVLAASFVVCDEVRMRRTKDVDLGYREQDGIYYFQHLQGPARNVAIIMNTQRLLVNMMHKYRNQAVVPREALEKFEPYLLDAQDAALKVKAVVPETPIELPKFEFIRKYFNAGFQTQQTVASITLPHAPAPWDIERMEREEKQRQQAMVDAEIAALRDGATRDVAVRTLRLKPKSGVSQ